MAPSVAFPDEVEVYGVESSDVTAWIACEVVDEEGGVRWFGHLKSSKGAAQHGPGWTSPEDAMVWARQRCSSIYIRLREEGRYWWAGEGVPPPGGPPTAGSIRWGDSAPL